LIFLFLGGFTIAAAVQRWGLHRRLALAVIGRVGTRPDALVGGFMVTAGILSMGVSNTATPVMMLPIAVSVIGIMAGMASSGADGGASKKFPTTLLLAIAYGAGIGGVGTLIGTPPNALLAGFIFQNYGVEIGFVEWMLLGVPFSVVMMGLSWLVLTRVLFSLRRTDSPDVAGLIGDERPTLGPMTRGETSRAIIFAITAAIALFLIPVTRTGGQFALDWESVKGIPWNVLILFGGGLSPAAASAETGLAGWLGASLEGLGAWPLVAIVLAITALIVFLTELTSSTAAAAAFLPVIAPLAVTLWENPLLFLVPAAMGASCAFMMPVATPPNAIIFGSGHVTIP
jgi:sodium-dependent dicarboxylate transporter 2/3/5